MKSRRDILKISLGLLSGSFFSQAKSANQETSLLEKVSNHFKTLKYRIPIVKNGILSDVNTTEQWPCFVTTEYLDSICHISDTKTTTTLWSPITSSSKDHCYLELAINNGKKGGTGFNFGRNHIITNEHVIIGVTKNYQENINKCHVTFGLTGLAGGKDITCKEIPILEENLSSGLFNYKMLNDDGLDFHLLSHEKETPESYFTNLASIDHKRLEEDGFLVCHTLGYPTHSDSKWPEQGRTLRGTFGNTFILGATENYLLLYPPIAEGGSGSPVFDRVGNIIGIVTERRPFDFDYNPKWPKEIFSNNELDSTGLNLDYPRNGEFELGVVVRIEKIVQKLKYLGFDFSDTGLSLNGRKIVNESIRCALFENTTKSRNFVDKSVLNAIKALDQNAKSKLSRGINTYIGERGLGHNQFQRSRYYDYINKELAKVKSCQLLNLKSEVFLNTSISTLQQVSNIVLSHLK